MGVGIQNNDNQKRSNTSAKTLYDAAPSDIFNMPPSNLYHL